MRLLHPLAIFALLIALPSAGQEQPAPLVVDEIELSGVTVFPRAELEGALEIVPGDRLERIKVVRTAENIQNLYRTRGYEQAGIQSRLLKRPSGNRFESVLEFLVKEGTPTRIAEIKFVQEHAPERGGDKAWKRLESSMALKVGLVPGDLLDQARISNARRLLQDLLASEEFIGANADDVRWNDTQAPLELTQQPAARWVSVEFHVNLGDRVTFGFRGNSVIPSNRLWTLVEEQRVVGFGKDYVGGIRLRIEEEYRSLGYAHCRVRPFTFENPRRQERHITYAIEEGPRVALEAIGFDGNSVFSEKELRSRFLAHASSPVQHGYYVQSDIQKAAELLVEWLKSQGYLAAKVVTINTEFAPGARITVYVYEGEQTLLHSIVIKGASVFSSAEIGARLGLREGASLNLFALSEGLETLKADYRAKGYLSARIVNEDTNQLIHYSRENRYADITIEISEGPQYRVSRINIEGLLKTREEVVRRELLFREGDVLRERELMESEARLRRLGIFSAVTTRVQDDPEKEGHKSVRLSFQEGTPGVIAGGPGYRNDLGFRLFGQIAYSNLWGRNHTVSLNATVNRRLEDYRFYEGQIQLGYLWPAFLQDDILFRPALTASAFQYISFAAKTISLASTWEKRILRRPNLTGALTYNLERILQERAANPLDEYNIQIGSLIPSLQLDLRDNPLAPTSGLFAMGSFELAAPMFFSQTRPYPVSYWRLLFRSDYHLPVTSDVTWFFSFRSGFEKSMVAHDVNNPPKEKLYGAIPTIKTFAVGGPGSLRGFSEQKLNVYETAIYGTASYVNYRTQLDLPFSGALRFGPFVDAANLLIDEFSFGRLRFGAGLGFHYQTPVGPVNLDWGFNLDPKPSEDPWMFHFSIGVI